MNKTKTKAVLIMAETQRSEVMSTFHRKDFRPHSSTFFKHDVPPIREFMMYASKRKLNVPAKMLHFYQFNQVMVKLRGEELRHSIVCVLQFDLFVLLIYPLVSYYYFSHSNLQYFVIYYVQGTAKFNCHNEPNRGI